MLLGYMITAAVVVAFALLVVFGAIELRSERKNRKTYLDWKAIACLAVIVAFFLAFALAYVHPVEQLYFDENIYQGIAINILHSGNALWCQYGTGDLTACYVNALYHDIVGYDVFIAAAFALFGSSVQVAYALQLLVGALSIICVFLLAGVLSGRRSVALTSSLVFALLPELYIWSRTEAVPDLPFMMLTTFAIFLFVVFLRRPSTRRLVIFMSSLVLVFYTRTEGLLMVPFLVLFYFLYSEDGIWKTVRARISLLRKGLDEPAALGALLVFVLLLLPVIYYSVQELQTGSYGNGPTQSLFSVANFVSNFGPNSQFLIGSLQLYPIVSTLNLLPLAIAGSLLLFFYERGSNRFATMALLVVLFLIYFLFYCFFYAGSVNYGVDVRFVLQMLPFLAILAGFCLSDVVSIVSDRVNGLIGSARSQRLFLAVFSAAVLAVLVAAPFAWYAPMVTLSPGAMPQESYPTNATGFFYNNYGSVPTNCLVFSFTPDLWYQYNRSAAQVGYLSGANSSMDQSFMNYSCYVLDYGYWCTVPPYENTLCSTLTSRYSTVTLASESNGRGSQFAFYRLLNYSP